MFSAKFFFMFGYIRLLKEELKIREFIIFGPITAVCAGVESKYGRCSTLLFNYDVTFLGLFLFINREPGEIISRKVFSPPPEKAEFFDRQQVVVLCRGCQSPFGLSQFKGQLDR